MGVKIPTDIPNAAYPTPGQGLVLDVNGQLPLAVRQTLPGYEYAYTEFTSNVSITATTEATANTIVTAPAVAFDGTTAVWINIYAPDWNNGAVGQALQIVLYQDGSSIGRPGPVFSSASSFELAVPFARRMTPTAGIHTYSARAYLNAGAGGVAGAGPGGSGNYMPGFIRITRV